jgi:hypothetical protein
MAGRRGDWAAIGAQMRRALHPDEIKTQLNAVVLRRNQIVHEGDYERLEKPRGPRRNRVTQAQCAADIDFLAQLINAIHAVV